MSYATKIQYQARVDAMQQATTKRTPETYCELYKLLDYIYQTGIASPLHHDNRCTLNHKEA